jgi:hypothetical protein
MARKKLLQTLKGLADKYEFDYVGLTSKSHHKWRHRKTDRILITVSNATSFHALKNTEQTMRQVSNGQHRFPH